MYMCVFVCKNERFYFLLSEQIVKERNSFNIPVYILLPFNVYYKKKKKKNKTEKNKAYT